MNILFSTESTADLSEELIERYKIVTQPLYVEKGGKVYRDGVDINVQDIFAYVDAGNPICGTAALNVEDYKAFFQEKSPLYDAVIQTTISSDFSSCFQNASIAAEDFPNVYVVDSRNLSTGIAHVILEGIRKSRTTDDIEEILSCMREVTARVDTSFVIKTLSYLAKGGRCSSVAALGANLLKLRPVIEVVDGKMRVGKKYRGAYTKCVVNYVEDRLKERKENDELLYDRIFITHAYATDETVEAVRKAVEAAGAFAEILETHAGCTISSHCGPECLGILFIRK
ncbi:MAG: DegV family protein [Clostridia bacterium]|nr:DegV family protein [Clostridia bacterium]